MTQDEMPVVHAWECENCGQWRPGSMPNREDPYAVLVDVPISTEVFDGNVSRRLRTRKVMVVCSVCRALMASGKRP